VKKGQVIAEFDRQYMLLRLDDYRANTDQVESNLKSLEANLDVEKKAHQQSIESARSALEKARLDLKTIPVQSEIMTEKLKLAAEEAAAQYKQLLAEVKHKDASQRAERRIARLDLDESKVELKRAEANADRMLFKAPMDGVTVMGTTFRGGEIGQIQVGDMVWPGMMFMRVVDPSSMVVTANLNQVDVELVRVGSKARVHFDAYPDLELPARVHSIAAMPKSGGFRAAYVKEVPVILKLDGIDPRVIPDLSVGVDIVIDAGESATLVPLESVFRDATGQPFVFVQAPAGWERRTVELGAANHIAAAVRNGLRPGEVVAAEWPPEIKR
jgi:multidrug resistance efflux pump